MKANVSSTNQVLEGLSLLLGVLKESKYLAGQRADRKLYR